MSKNIWRNESEWKAIDDRSVFIRVFSLGSGGGWSGDQSLIRKPIRTCHHGHDYLGTWHMCTPIREYLLNSHRHTVISQKRLATHRRYMGERIGVFHFRRLSIYFSKAPREWKASGAQANLFQFSAAASSCAKKGAWIAVLQIFDGCWPGIGVVVPASVYVLVTRIFLCLLFVHAEHLLVHPMGTHLVRFTILRKKLERCQSGNLWKKANFFNHTVDLSLSQDWVRINFNLTRFCTALQWVHVKRPASGRWHWHFWQRWKIAKLRPENHESPLTFITFMQTLITSGKSILLWNDDTELSFFFPDIAALHVIAHVSYNHDIYIYMYCTCEVEVRMKLLALCRAGRLALRDAFVARFVLLSLCFDWTGGQCIYLQLCYQGLWTTRLLGSCVRTITPHERGRDSRKQLHL